MAPRETSSTFTHLSLLGRGGMADVYLAKDQSGELVALKRLRDTSELTFEYRTQLKREAAISALMNHPNVVRFRGFGEDASGPFLALDYVRGVPVSSLLRGVETDGAALPLEAALSLCIDVSRGIAYAHALETGDDDGGVVHRDITPSNVLLSADGVARVADFGIARLAQQTNVTATGHVRGKLSYLAPELFHGAQATFSSDCFALACTVFEIFTCLKPFRGNTEAELVNSLLHGEPARLSALRPSTPAPVADWVQRAMSRRPDERPQAHELAALCEAALGERKGQGERELASWVDRLSPRSQPARTLEAPLPRRPVRTPVSLAIGLGAAALVVTLGVTLLLMREPPRIAPVAAEPQRPIAEPPPADLRPPIADPAPAVAETAPERPPEPPPPTSKPAPRRSAVKVKKPAASPDPAPTTGLLRVEAEAGTVVFVDGQRVGEAPLSKLAVAPGEHVVLLVNRGLGVSQSRRVRIVAGETTGLSVSFASP